MSTNKDLVLRAVTLDKRGAFDDHKSGAKTALAVGAASSAVFGVGGILVDLFARGVLVHPAIYAVVAALVGAGIGWRQSRGRALGYAIALGATAFLGDTVLGHVLHHAFLVFLASGFFGGIAGTIAGWKARRALKSLKA